MALTLYANGKIETSTGSVLGITHVDTWMLNADKNWSGSNIFDADWSRSTSGIFGNIGAPMTKASGGVHSFPVTGIWEMHYRIMVSDATENAYSWAWIDHTINNGGAWETLVEAADAIPDDGSNATFANPYCHCTLDVYDVSNCKVRFKIANEQGAVIRSSSDGKVMKTGVVFKRLGDT
tara:strand:- start:3 stop:539 length:537 start_codon:yes stop_codon:yes gene_type:complete